MTAITAAVAAIGLVALSLAVSLARARSGIGIGLGDDALLRRIRAQGNFTEYVPLALVILALAEYRGASDTWLWMIAGLLMAGRCIHASAMLMGSTNGRAVGMVATHSALLIGSAVLLLG